MTEVDAANALPWELLREPGTATHLALHASSFVRAQPDAARRPRLPADEAGPVRILLAICRPGGSGDVPFRSVAARIVKSLGGTAREAFDLDVLRPPTYEQLARELRRAKNEGRPFHVLHFDGHGTYLEAGGPGLLRRLRDGLSPLLLSGQRKGKHGCLANAGRLQDALAYAEAALRGFESCGESAAELVQRTRQLIEQIRQQS